MGEGQKKFPVICNSCCWCLTLEEGTIILAFLCMVYGAIKAFVGLGGAIYFWKEGCKAFAKNWDCVPTFLYSGIMGIVLGVLGIMLFFGSEQKSQKILVSSLFLTLLYIFFGLIVVIVMALDNELQMLFNLISIVLLAGCTLIVVYNYFAVLREVQ